MMKRLSVILFLVFVFCSLINCSNNNGIEGTVILFGSDKPIDGIKVEALTETDIKEQMDKSLRSSKTNSKGNFKFSGLIPGKKYKISVKDHNYKNIAKIVKAPEEGTRVLDKPIIAYPLPPEKGVYLYNINNSQMEKIQYTNKIVKLRKIEWRRKGVFCGKAWYMTDEDINIEGTEINRDSLIVLYGGNVESIGQLNKISEKTIKTYCIVNIKTAWYYNIKDITTKKFLGKDMLKFIKSEPNLEKKLRIGELMVIPLKDFSPGFYFFATKYIYMKGPESGFIIKII